MLKKSLILSGWAVGQALSFAAAQAADYTFAHPEHPFYLIGNYRAVGSADFRRHSNGHLNYSDAYGSVYYSHFLNPENSFSWQLGYYHLGLDWDKNPRFHQKDFNYGMASLSYVCQSIKRWRFVTDIGVSVDTHTFDFGQTAVYYALLWGRYQWLDNLGLHAGFFGYVGVKNGYMLPVVGVDWVLHPRWKLNAVFPVDLSLTYQIRKRWYTALAYSNFGGPYRFPRRVTEKGGKFEHAIFEVYARGLELDLNYKNGNRIWMGLGAGYNFGGWIFIKNAHNRHGKYYKFEAAPFGQATLALNF